MLKKIKTLNFRNYLSSILFWHNDVKNIQQVGNEQNVQVPAFSTSLKQVIHNYRTEME